MREIIFRGKRADNSEWVEGSLIYSKASVGTDCLAVIVESCEWDNTQEWFNICKRSRVIPSTIGQYTGLTDKNGKKIFEGDVIVDNFFKFLPNKPHIATFYEEYRYRKYEDLEFEVIGNMHDNPELLTERIKNNDTH